MLRVSCSSPAIALVQLFDLIVVCVCCVSVVDKFSVVYKFNVVDKRGSVLPKSSCTASMYF